MNAISFQSGFFLCKICDNVEQASLNLSFLSEFYIFLDNLCINFYKLFLSLLDNFPTLLLLLLWIYSFLLISNLFSIYNFYAFSRNFLLRKPNIILAVWINSIIHFSIASFLADFLFFPKPNTLIGYTLFLSLKLKFNVHK